MEQHTGSKLGKYIKAVYCHPAYLTYMQSTSCKIPPWMKHKLESKLSGEISISLPVLPNCIMFITTSVPAHQGGNMSSGAALEEDTGGKNTHKDGAKTTVGGCVTKEEKIKALPVTAGTLNSNLILQAL